VNPITAFVGRFLSDPFYPAAKSEFRLLRHRWRKYPRWCGRGGEAQMKSIVAIAVAAMIAVAAVPGSVQAAGCLKGAAVGGVAGHFVGHHGLIGAGIGCVVGRHNANKRAAEHPEQNYR
jgi:hypothetical protein